MDDSVDGRLAVHAHTEWSTFAHWVSKMGEWYVIVAAGALYSLSRLTQCRFQEARNLMFVTFTGLGTGLTGTVLRCLAGRTRPDAQVPPGFYGFWHGSHFIFGQYQFSSFPSGHVATAAGFAAAAWLINRRAGFCAGLLAVLVAWSRIAQSAHHFSDVVAAALWGVIGALWMQEHFKPVFIPGFNSLSKSWIRTLITRRNLQISSPNRPTSPRPATPGGTLT
jgi:membrane-associated phospholipid phosphatase